MKHLKIKNLNVLYTEKGDDYSKILEKLPVKNVIFPHQTHSSNIKNYKCSLENCDAVWTEEKNIALGVKTADCVPVVLTDFNKLAVIHAGWRGIVGGIVENALNLFDKNIEVAYIAPSARSCCYEVKDNFLENLGKYEKMFIKKRNSKIYFALEEIVRKKLEIKVKKIIDSGLCTICNESLFSYRKGDLKERMLTIGWLEE